MAEKEIEINELQVDEIRRAEQHEDIKGQIRQEVNRGLADHVELNANDQAQMATAAQQLKHKAIKEVAETEGDLDREKGMARVSQIINYVFYVIYGLIGLEIGLELLGARQSSTFKQFIDSVTSPFLAPFKGLLHDPSIGPFQFMVSYIMALVVFLLIHQAMSGFLRLIVHKQSTI